MQEDDLIAILREGEDAHTSRLHGQAGQGDILDAKMAPHLLSVEPGNDACLGRYKQGCASVSAVLGWLRRTRQPGLVHG